MGYAGAVAQRDITEILSEVGSARDGAEAELVERLYVELHRLASSVMRRERAGHTLQTTALVNEAWLSVVGNADPAHFENRAHFLGSVARAMRQTLIHYARTRSAQKRGGGFERQELVEMPDLPALPFDDVLTIHEALEELETDDPRAARVVELRFFAGAELEEIADTIGVSAPTVKRDWRFARAWLLAKLEEE